MCGRRAEALGLVALGLLLGGECAAMLQPRVVKTLYPAADVVIASLVVSAEGLDDAAAAIQAAIDEAAGAGGGVVFLPAGRYRLGGQLVVREGVTLRGDWAPPDRGVGATGTILMPIADRGHADGPPAITLERGSGIREVTIWYPDQRAQEIVPYPWTIKTSEAAGGDNYTVHNVTLVNPYQAIKVGPESNELHTIRNVYGTPLKVGVWVDTCTDIGRLIEVDFGPRWWEESGLEGAPVSDTERATLRAFLRREGIGVDMGRSDWEYLYGVRVSGYGIGMRFGPGSQGTTNAVMFGSALTDCGTALWLEDLNGIGLSATGCRLSGDEQAVLAPGSFSTICQLNTCELSAEGGSAVVLEGPGTLTLQNCDFRGWEGAALDARGGQVCVMGCQFVQGGTHVRLGARVRRARLLGNTFGGEAHLELASSGDVQVAHRDLGFARPDISLHRAPPDRRPATGELFVVTDFGASPTMADNTGAFMRALEAGRRAGGGTVYVPAGNYRFAGELVVPTGVELRGVFDVPHHTVSGGSVLMPTAGRGNPDGTPFIRLQERSGVRGLTIWYPEQDHSNIQPYPWAIQSTGPGCWLLDVTLGNAYQGADFWTYPSEGHLIRYLAGACLRQGLLISKCEGQGWVEDVQFNPHYAFRLPPGLPQKASEGGEAWNSFLRYQWEHLDGIVLGRCADEHLRGTFLYAAHDGLALRDDDGGPNARIIQHGTDAGSRGVVLEATGERGAEFINTQIVHFGPFERAALIVTDSFAGKARLFNTQMWAGPRSGIIGGSGEVLVQQLNTLTGPFTLSGGRCSIQNAHFSGDLNPHVTVEAGCQRAELIGNVAPEEFRIVNRAGERCYARANAASLRPSAMPCMFRTGWEEGEPQGLSDAVATATGGPRSVSNATCRPTTTHAHTGNRALRIAGNADDPAYSFIYFRVFDGPLAVNADSVLSYWIRPENERGRCVGIDLLFNDGATLRDSGLRAEDGRGVHPASGRGQVGEWTEVRIALGKRFARRVIVAMMLAYDSREGGGPFEAFVDDVALESAQGAAPWQVSATPKGGAYRGPVRVALWAEGAAGVRYTLDGTAPSATSPLYEGPITLDAAGLWEVRFAAQAPDGTLSSVVWSELYDIRP